MIRRRIFLTRLTGLGLGFQFGWYVHGPRNRELTADAFSLKGRMELDDDESKGRRLSMTAAELAARDKGIRANRPPSVLGNDGLELLASWHYLRHSAWWPEGSVKDMDGVFEGLVKSNPRCAGRRGDAEAAWR